MTTYSTRGYEVFNRKVYFEFLVILTSYTKCTESIALKEDYFFFAPI